MRLPAPMKSAPVVFICAWAILLLGLGAIYLAFERFEETHRFDLGLILGIASVIWGLWVLLFYKRDE